MSTSSSRGALVFAVVAALTSAVHPLVAQSKDPLIGNWALNVNKSTFAGAAPIRRTMTFTDIPNGITETITTTTSGGANITYKLVYTAKFDGKEYPADVASSLDTVSLKRIDARSVERIGKVKGQVVQTETYAVSPDGHMLTVTQEGQNNGVPFKSAQMFERQ
jgi:hypothetical protein